MPDQNLTSSVFARRLTQQAIQWASKGLAAHLSRATTGVLNVLFDLKSRVVRWRQRQQIQVGSEPPQDQEPSSDPCPLRYLSDTREARVCATCGLDISKALHTNLGEFMIDYEDGLDTTDSKSMSSSNIARYRVEKCGHTRHAECLICFVYGKDIIGHTQGPRPGKCEHCESILKCRCHECEQRWVVAQRWYP